MPGPRTPYPVQPAQHKASPTSPSDGQEKGAGGLRQGHTARRRYKEGSDPGLCGAGRAGGCGSRGRGQRAREGHCGFRLRFRAERSRCSDLPLIRHSIAYINVNE